jgi:FtsH-binding integral membrane protein
MFGATGALSRAEAWERTFVAKVYGWMFLALMITAGVAAAVAHTPALAKLVLGNPVIFWGLIISELVLVIAIGAAINKISSGAAVAMFLVYSAMNGATLSVIFLRYTEGSIFTTFVVTAVMFGSMALYGSLTKADLTSIGSICFMLLIGFILASVVNIIWHNEALYWITTYAGIVIFVGLTAYDAQKVKRMAALEEEGAEVATKGAVLGALALYLDFINLLLLLLRVLGRRR